MAKLEEAVKQLKNDKAPSPGDFTTNFFHACLSTIKEEVLDIVEEFWKTSKILKYFNSTFLTLIPKENGADSASKFQPVALCNVIFKIITKTISNRLKTILSNLVPKEQSGYIECRQILDGIILSHEIIHSLKDTKKVSMLIKLDLSKSFDKLKWDFMKKILKAFGFCDQWVS